MKKKIIMLLIFIIFLLIGWSIQTKLKSKIKKYSSIKISSNLSGKEVAEKMLIDHGITKVSIVSVPGRLTDHYNPQNMTINLSKEVYYGKSISSAAIASHECGHAVQHANAYRWLEMRSKLVPIVSFSSKMINFIFIAGMFGMGIMRLFTLDIVILTIIFSQLMVTIFSLITLPVEYDASNRAVKWLENANITSGNETTAAKDALNWAAKTYLVAALSSLTYLLYYIMIFLNNRN